MVQAVISLTDYENRIINIVKGKFGLRNKSEAIEHIIKSYEEEMLEPELRPEYIEKLKKIDEEKTIKVKDFRKHFGLEK
jgi:hypothetical protein